MAVQEARPALRTAEFFATYFDLAARGELDERGMPSLLRLTVLVPAFADEMRVAEPAVAGAARGVRPPPADRSPARLRRIASRSM